MKLILRPMTFSDLKFFCRLRRELIFDETKRWFSDTKPEIYIINNSADIGAIQVNRNKPFEQACEIRIDIYKKFRRRGIGTDACRILFETLFKEDVNEVFVSVLENNMEAFSFFRKLGFRVCEWKPLMKYSDSDLLGGFILSLGVKDWFRYDVYA